MIRRPPRSPLDRSSAASELYKRRVPYPFMGSGTTAVAAVRTGRHFVGYDTDPEYVAAATARVAAEQQATADTPVAAPQVPDWLL